MEWSAAVGLSGIRLIGQQPTDTFVAQIVARPVSIGTILPVSRDRHVNEARIDRAHVFETGAERRQFAGSEPSTMTSAPLARS